MSIAVTCGSCGRSLSAPDTAAGKKIKCSKCGGVTVVGSAVPAAKPAAKICTDCGTDVASQPRTKDPAGRYFCRPCWSARLANQPQAAQAQTAASSAGAAGRNAPPVSSSNPFDDTGDRAEDSAANVCPACGREASSDDMTTDDMGEPICWPCQNERNGPLELSVPAPAAVSRSAVATAAASAVLPPPTARASSTDATTLMKKLGMLALGLVMLAFFVIWPMYQVTEHVEHISISFKGILLSAIVTPMAVLSLVFGDSVVRWKKTPKQPQTATERIALVVTLLIAAGMVWGVYSFFDAHGYTIKW